MIKHATAETTGNRYVYSLEGTIYSMCNTMVAYNTRGDTVANEAWCFECAAIAAGTKLVILW